MENFQRFIAVLNSEVLANHPELKDEIDEVIRMIWMSKTDVEDNSYDKRDANVTDQDIVAAIEQREAEVKSRRKYFYVKKNISQEEKNYFSGRIDYSEKLSMLNLTLENLLFGIVLSGKKFEFTMDVFSSSFKRDICGMVGAKLTRKIELSFGYDALDEDFIMKVKLFTEAGVVYGKIYNIQEWIGDITLGDLISFDCKNECYKISECALYKHMKSCCRIIVGSDMTIDEISIVETFTLAMEEFMRQIAMCEMHKIVK